MTFANRVILHYALTLMHHKSMFPHYAVEHVYYWASGPILPKKWYFLTVVKRLDETRWRVDGGNGNLSGYRSLQA